MTSAHSRLLFLATLVTALAVAAATVPAGAQETPAAEPAVTVSAIVQTPEGPSVQRHAAGSRQEADRLVEELQARDDVVAAEVNVRVRSLQDTASDPDRALQWALDTLDAEDAWALSDASNRVIAVIDSGVDASHPDLDGVVVEGMDVFNTATLGQVDPLTPCPGASHECRGHGTHVAGIIGAVVGNGIGGAGLARGASIMPVRVLDPAGFGDSDDVADGIIFATDNGAHVINLSLGSTEESDLLEFAVAYATRRGSLVVAAAGNMGPHTPVIHPAVDPWTLAVGATDRNDQVAPFSGQGPWVDLVAPGVDIYSTRPTTGPEYASDDGTSMATPYVSAAAALVQRRYPSLSPSQVAAHLRATATDLPPAGRDPVSGNGLVNPVQALSRIPGAGEACDRRRVPSSGFRDVVGNSHLTSIDCVVWFQVSRGATTTSYAPSSQVTRGQMASFIARLLTRSGVELPGGGGQRFSDVPFGNVHFESINRLAGAGIVEGQGSTYAPNRVVTRDQMASFLVRSYDYAQGQIGRFSLPPATRRFTDTAGNVHEGNINKAAAAGFANGVTATEYAPRRGVRRDQMAAFVVRTLERLARR